MTLPGNGHHGSPLRLHNLSPASPPYSCCLYSDYLTPPIPPLVATQNGRGYDPGTNKHALKFFRRSKFECSPIFLSDRSGDEIDISLGQPVKHLHPWKSTSRTQTPTPTDGAT